MSTSLQEHMASNVGASIANPVIDGRWHSGKRSDGLKADKISYVGHYLPKGLLVRYRHHGQGDECFVYQEGAELVRISGIVGAVTGKAVKLDGADNWYPLAKIEVTSGLLRKGEAVVLSVPSWLAEGQGEYVQPAEYQARKAAADEKARAAEQAATAEKVRILAVLQAIIKESVPASADHPYIARKLIIPIGARQATKRYQITPATAESKAQHIHPNDLLIPVYDHIGQLQGIQQITDSGYKLMRGAFKGGLLWIGGGLTTGETPNRLYIAEGWGTAVSIHMRTRNPVIVAFSTSNLLNTGHWARGRYPDSEIVYAIDNDIGSVIKIGGQTIENPGKHYATQAAIAVNAAVITPPTDEKGDWNDWHISQIADTKKAD